MSIQTNAMKNILSDAYKGAAAYGAVYTTAPGASAGTEPSGGSPAYTRKALSWSASSGGATTASPVFGPLALLNVQPVISPVSGSAIT